MIITVYSDRTRLIDHLTWQGKPHREQDQIETIITPYLVWVGCLKLIVILILDR